MDKFDGITVSKVVARIRELGARQLPIRMTSRLRSCNVTKTVRGNLSSFRQLQLSDAAHTCTIVCKLDHTDCFLSCWNCLTMFTKRKIALATTL